MILSEIRTRVFEELDWAPDQSDASKARVDRMINRALEQMVLEAPYLFEQEWKVTTQADFIPTLTGDAVSVYNSDPWVLQRDITSTAIGYAAWATDRTWDGRMIMITDSSGEKHFRRIRTIWAVTVSPGITQQRMTLDRPWPNTTDSAMDYHIFTDAYYYGRHIAEPMSIRLMVAGDTTPLEWMTTQEMENYAGRDLPGTYPTSTSPRVAYPMPHMEILAPNTAPVIANAEQGNNWAGPRLAGTFHYKYTYVWGVRDFDEAHQGPTLSTSSGTRRTMPLWESSPSPASALATATNTGTYITVTMPNIEFELGFNNSASPSERDGKSGIYKRIYVRRVTENTASPRSGAPTHHDIRDQYYLIAEVSGDTDTYNDDGSDIPDLLYPLRDSSRYEGFGLYPRPSAETEIKIRAVVQPEKLVSDHDSTSLPGIASDALVYCTLAMMYRREHNQIASDRADKRYGELLDKCNARYGAGTSAAEPVRKRLARAKHGRRSYKPYKRWW